MNQLIRAEGIEALLEKLPEEYRRFDKFGRIEKLQYSRKFDEETWEEVPYLYLLLADDRGKYHIEMTCVGVHGLIAFDAVDGFFDGLAVEDLSGRGFDKDEFHIFSFEQDIRFDFYCDKITVGLVD